MRETRRSFLRKGACAVAGAMAAAAAEERAGFVRALALAEPQTLTDYKALVCVFLDGGNDGNNTVVPFDDYNAAGGYASVRTSSGLAVPRDQLLPVTAPSHQSLKFGLHPNLPELQALYNQRRLAVMCNTGTLVQPLTRPLYRAGVGHPYQLFSHSDQIQQQQTVFPTEPARTGWAGRLSDLMSAANGASPVPLCVSTAGATLFATGGRTRQLVLDPERRINESLRVDVGGDFPPGSQAARRAAFDRIRADASSTMALTVSQTLNEAMRAGAAITADPQLPPPQAGQSDFPDTSIGRQLRHVAKMISIREQVGTRRQVFFCNLLGFDHHFNQHNTQFGQDVLLLQLSRALRAFYDATVRLGVASQVTTFTLSDFGRTFEPSGAGAVVGSDHAWGNHHFILGDAVRGGDFYGTYPTLALGGPDDAFERGVWIPTTSTDQFAATLALWFGLPQSSLAAVFPFVGRFATPNLGFMS
ncbi:MAG TPA: DUF1501 domain-containing protein [Pyrinomonadaceae bacterium]|nr:DUF1501 domain-containing protein [Pyrinomonadaceae bacterium]